MKTSKHIAIAVVGLVVLWFFFGTLIKVALGAAVLGGAWYAWNKFKKSP